MKTWILNLDVAECISNNKPQPNLYSGDTCLGPEPEGVPEQKFHCNPTVVGLSFSLGCGVKVLIPAIFSISRFLK